MKRLETTPRSRGVIVLRNVSSGERRIVITERPLDASRRNDQVVRLPDGKSLVVPRRANLKTK
jgi:hypothetical protein